MKLGRLASLLVCSSSLAFVIALGLGACGNTADGPVTTDTGVSDSKVDAKDPKPTHEITVLSPDKSDDIPADLSCMGKGPPDAGPPSDTGGETGDAAVDPDAPAPTGTPIDINLKVVEFGGGGSDIVVGANVDIFYKATLIPEVADQKGMTDSKGLYLVKLPAGLPFAYRVNGNDKLRTFVDFSAEAPRSRARSSRPPPSPNRSTTSSPWPSRARWASSPRRVPEFSRPA